MYAIKWDLFYGRPYQSKVVRNCSIDDGLYTRNTIAVVERKIGNELCEVLKDRKEEVWIGNPECQMQRLKLSILANNSIKAIVILIINRALVQLLNDIAASHII